MPFQNRHFCTDSHYILIIFYYSMVDKMSTLTPYKEVGQNVHPPGQIVHPRQIVHPFYTGFIHNGLKSRFEV